MERPKPMPSTVRRRPRSSMTSADGSSGATPSFVIYLAICLVSAGCQLATKAFWIELPAMFIVSPSTTLTAPPSLRPSAVFHLPESDGQPVSNHVDTVEGSLRWTLSVQHQARLFAVIVATSNAIACFLYLAAGRICPRHHRRPVESRAVWASLVIGVASLALAAGGYEFGSMLENGVFLAEEIPLVAVLIGAALSAVGSTTGAIALLSVVGQLGVVTSSGGGGAGSYVCAAMFGDALASMVPRSLSIVQGIGRTPENGTSVVMETNGTSAVRSAILVNENDDVTVSFRSEAIVGSRVSHRFYAVQSSSLHGSANRQTSHSSSGTGHHYDIINNIHDIADPHFSESIYFSACAACILVSIICFAAVRCCVCFGGLSESSQNVGSSTIASGFRFRLPFDRSRSVPTSSTVSVPLPRSSSRGNESRPNITFSPLGMTSPTRLPETSDDAIGGDSTAKPEGTTTSAKHSTTITILDDGTERHATDFTSTATSGDVRVVANNTAASSADANSTSTSGQPPSIPSSAQLQCRPMALNTENRPVAVKLSVGNRNSRSMPVPPSAGRPKLFQLLIAIVLMTSVVLSGPLSDVLAHAYYPTGSWTFAVGAAGCDIVSAAACIVAARATARSEMSTVIAMTCLGMIVLTYFGALVAFGQHVGVGRSVSGVIAGVPGGTVDAALMMGSTGEYLAVAAWTTVVAVFSFARVRIGVECRLAGPEALFWYACALRIGDVIGSTAIIGQISVGRFFKRNLR